MVKSTLTGCCKAMGRTPKNGLSPRVQLWFVALTLLFLSPAVFAESEKPYEVAFEGIPEMRVDNILRYRDLNEVRAVLNAKATAMEARLGRQCDTSHCSNIRYLGPCLAMKYYLKYIKK